MKKFKFEYVIYTIFFIIGIFSIIFNLETLRNSLFILFLSYLIIKSYNSPQFFIVILILLSTNCFYLLPSKVFGIQIEKIEIIVFIFSFLFNTIKSKSKKNIEIRFDKYTKYLLLTVLIIFFGALIPYVTIGQSFINGILYQTRILIILSVFPLINLLKNRKINSDNIYSIIIRCSTIFSILLIIQYFMITKFSFLNIEVNTSRFGSMRIYLYMFTSFSIFVIFNELIKGKKKMIVPLFLNFFVLLYIIQSRMAFFGVIVALIISFLSSSNFKLKKTYPILFGSAILLLIGGIMFHGIIFDLIDLASKEITTNSGNYSARFLEQQFYLKQVDNKYLGRGYYSSKTEGALKYVTAYNYYDLTDIGVVGLYVTNGILGIIWFILISYSLFKFSHKNKILGKNMFVPISFLIFSIVTMFTLLPYYYNAEYLIITYLILELEKNTERVK